MKLSVYKIGGTGPVLHFYHANSFCARLYLPILESLCEHFSVYAADIRGHGSSEIPKSINHWEEIAADLLKVIPAISDQPVIAVGHSLGAVASMIAAVKSPSSFRQLIALDPVIFSFHHLLVFDVMRRLKLKHHFPPVNISLKRRTEFASREQIVEAYSRRKVFSAWNDEMLQNYAEYCFRDDNGKVRLCCPPEIEADIYAAIPLKTWHYMKHIAVPVHVIRGNNSDTLLEKPFRKLTRINPLISSEVIHDHGHLFPMEAPKLTVQYILRHLAVADTAFN